MNDCSLHGTLHGEDWSTENKTKEQIIDFRNKGGEDTLSTSVELRWSMELVDFSYCGCQELCLLMFLWGSPQ